MPTEIEIRDGQLQALQSRDDEIKRLRGTLRYIATQAKAAHPGALAVIQANAEAALDEGTQRLARVAAST